MIFTISNLHPSDSLAKNFKKDMEKHSRVKTARKNTKYTRSFLFKHTDIKPDSMNIFLRIFKYEKELELWAKNPQDTVFEYIKSYKFTGYCGDLGPKRCQGDKQIPEGVYFIDRFNPQSKFHLSLGSNYPNKSDKARTSCDDPGGDIFIHGNNVTIGCVPIGDRHIEELFILAVDAKASGQYRIPVHIFPFRMDDKDRETLYQEYIRKSPELESFWSELKSVYIYFQEKHEIPEITIEENGAYKLK